MGPRLSYFLSLSLTTFVISRLSPTRLVMHYPRSRSVSLGSLSFNGSSSPVRIIQAASRTMIATRRCVPKRILRTRPRSCTLLPVNLFLYIPTAVIPGLFYYPHKCERRAKKLAGQNIECSTVVQTQNRICFVDGCYCLTSVNSDEFHFPISYV